VDICNPLKMGNIVDWQYLPVCQLNVPGRFTSKLRATFRSVEVLAVRQTLPAAKSWQDMPVVLVARSGEFALAPRKQLRRSQIRYNRRKSAPPGCMPE